MIASFQFIDKATPILEEALKLMQAKTGLRPRSLLATMSNLAINYFF